VPTLGKPCRGGLFIESGTIPPVLFVFQRRGAAGSSMRRAEITPPFGELGLVQNRAAEKQKE